MIKGAYENDYLGVSVSSAGDFNNDGFDDIIVGASGVDPYWINAGATYLIFGKESGYTAQFDLTSLDGVNGFVIDGAYAGDSSGSSVSSAGDFNNDGFDDIIIGAPYANVAIGEDSSDRISDNGASYVLYGKADGFNSSMDLSMLNSINGFAIIGADYYEHIGRNVSSAGDINGDGFDDILIGSLYNDGGTFVIYGKPKGTSSSLILNTIGGTNGFLISGDNSLVGYGNYISSAGDINGDGLADFIFSASSTASNGQNGAGETYVIFGRDFRNEGSNPLLASGRSEAQAVEQSSQIVSLTKEDLQPILNEAIARLSTIVDASLFDNIQVSIADLNGQLLGREQNGNIVIDINAAGFDWFIDSTPSDDSEFRYDSTPGQRQAITEEATGKIDLLSVLMHELGHAIGLEHDNTKESIMNSQLEAGTRSTELDSIDSFFSNESALAMVLDV